MTGLALVSLCFVSPAFAASVTAAGLLETAAAAVGLHCQLAGRQRESIDKKSIAGLHRAAPRMRYLGLGPRLAPKKLVHNPYVKVHAKMTKQSENFVKFRFLTRRLPTSPWAKMLAVSVRCIRPDIRASFSQKVVHCRSDHRQVPNTPVYHSTTLPSVQFELERRELERKKGVKF